MKAIAICISMFFGFLNLQPLAAQNGTVQGHVTDASTGEMLPGANIILDGGTTGTTTDSNGYFRIRNLNPGEQILTVSYLGYQTREVTVQIESELDFDLYFLT